MAPGGRPGCTRRVRELSEQVGSAGQGAELIELAVEELAADGLKATVDDRVIRLVNPVKGSPHLAVLQALGAAAGAPPVGAAAHGPAGVAAAVWLAPDLYVARWTGAARWVAAYRFPARARPDEYNREESGIPSRLNRGSWYGDVPDEVAEAFFSVGVLLDEPPFPVPAPPARPKPPAEEPKPARPRAPRAPAEPRTRRPKPPPKPAKAVPSTRTCPMCNLSKHPSQFIPGSDYCVDCR
jgi:rubredoxin